MQENICLVLQAIIVELRCNVATVAVLKIESSLAAKFSDICYEKNLKNYLSISEVTLFQLFKK